MIKKTIEVSIPFLNGNEKNYLEECINSNYVSSIGPFVDQFENKLANTIGLNPDQITTTNSGTSALKLALIASGIKRDDLVIIPSYTFIATANAISDCGGVPWIMDVLPESLTLDFNLVEEEIASKTFMKDGQIFHKELNLRVFGIVPVHVFGYAPELEEIIKLGKKYNLNIIADAAGGLGSLYKNKKLGLTVNSGIVSFNGNKIITSGGGGMFFSSDKKIVDKVKHLASTARLTSNYIHDQIGFNYRISNLHAAVGLAQIENFKTILERKLQISNQYKKYLNNPKINFFLSGKNSKSSNWLNAISFNNLFSGFNIDDFLKYMQINNINIRHYWRPIFLQPPYIKCPRSSQEICSNIYKNVIVLPSSSNLSEEEVKYISNKINSYIQ